MLYGLPLEELLRQSSQIRYRQFGRTVHFRVAHNYFPYTKCTSDCQFCAWCRQAELDYAKHEGLLLEVEDGISIDSYLASVRIAESLEADLELISNMERLSSEKLLNDICRILHKASAEVPVGIQPGLVEDKSFLLRLKRAGIRWYDNDIETAPSYFPQICTTHTQAEKEVSMRLAKKCELPVWTGICIGIGENPKQRIEAVERIRELNVEGVTIHFFYSVPGIPLYGKVPRLTTEDILKTIAITRILLPDKPIIIGTGRSSLLGNSQQLIYDAGATGIYLGMYMNHPRPSVQQDLKIVAELGLEVCKL